MDWDALLSAFGLVLIAELGDKTQLAVVAQTCKYRQPWAVLSGACVALTAVTAIGALAGHALARIVPPSILQGAAALGFVIMGLLVAREALKCRDGQTEEMSCLPEEETQPRRWDWKAFASTLGLLFVAELGDKTQLAVLGLAGRSRSPWTVFVGGSLALAVVSAIGVAGGEGLTRLVPRPVLLALSAAAFVVMGGLVGLGLL